MSKHHKFKTYNYDISLKIVLCLHTYNKINKTKCKITSSSLNKLDKFITIFIKTIFMNACLISLYNNNKNISSSIIAQIAESIIRGYEINILRFKQEYAIIKNPITDIQYSGKSVLDFFHIDIHQYDNFNETLDQMLNEIINIYGEGKIIKGEQELSEYIITILLSIINLCSKNQSIIDDKLLEEVSDLDYIIRIDNVLGGYDILKNNIPEFTDINIDEIKINDITQDNIEDEIKNTENYNIRYMGYPFNLNELVIN